MWIRHVLDRLVNKQEGNPLQLFILPFVEADGSIIYMSALVSELNENLMLSKDRLTIIKYGMLLVKPKFDYLERGIVITYWN